MKFEELWKLRGRKFERAVRSAVREHGTLAAACEALGWKYHPVYDRLYAMGLRVPFTGRSRITDAEEDKE